MPGPSVTALLLALTVTAEPLPPAAPTLESVRSKEATLEVMPRSALVEVDGKEQRRGLVTIDATDPKRIFRIRVSAEGFETREAEVLAGQAAARQVVVVLRPVGLDGPVDAQDAPSLALAASALLGAGRATDAVDYAEQSLRTRNNGLANRVLGDVWRQRGDRDRATRHYTMYLSLEDNPRDGPEIRAWLLQPRPGDITIPAR